MKILKEDKELKSILGVTLLSGVFILAVAYFLVPIILNYAPYSLEKDFQREVIGVTYDLQFLGIATAYILLIFLTTLHFIRPLFGYSKVLREKEIQTEKIQNIRNICMKAPIKIYIVQVILVAIVMAVILTLSGVPIELFFKIIAIVEMFMLTEGLYCNVVNKKYFDQIIIKTYNKVKEYKFQERELYSLKNTIFVQIFPLFVVAVLVSMFLGYTRVVNQKGESKYYYYSSKFPNEIINSKEVNVESIKEKLSKVTLKEEEDYYFILSPNNSEYVSSTKGTLSEFFKVYIKSYFDRTNGKGYEFYTIEEQAFVRKIIDSTGNEWYVGFKYTIVDKQGTLFLICSFIFLMLIYIVVVYIWAKSFSLSMKRIIRNLNDILKENSVDFGNVIPITSYDEIGVLADTYNKLQRMIENQIELLQKQAQLATLGELAGNMAHDINTPMASIDNSLSIIEQMATEKESVESKELLLVVGIMEKCSAKINKIINSMRNQVRTLGNNDIIEFNLKNTIEECILMLNSDILSINCNMVCKMKDVKIKGEPSKISQVVTSLLMNSIQAYRQNDLFGENIEIKLCKEKGFAVIEIKDYAKGIPEDIKPFVFKNILTVKGTNGTGLGLYLAYSIVKGVFGGIIEYESEQDYGTTFKIKIPL